MCLTSFYNMVLSVQFSFKLSMYLHVFEAYMYKYSNTSTILALLLGIIGENITEKQFRESPSAQLIKLYLNNTYPSTQQKKSLASSLNLTIGQVKFWISRIRKRAKKFGTNSTIKGIV